MPRSVPPTALPPTPSLPPHPPHAGTTVAAFNTDPGSATSLNGQFNAVMSNVTQQCAGYIASTGAATVRRRLLRRRGLLQAVAPVQITSKVFSTTPTVGRVGWAVGWTWAWLIECVCM